MIRFFSFFVLVHSGFFFPFCSRNFPEPSALSLSVLGSSLFNQTFGSVGSNSAFSSSGGCQQGSVDVAANSDPLLIMSKDTGFNHSALSFVPSNMRVSGSSGQIQNQQAFNSSGNPLLPDQQMYHVQQLEQLKFQSCQQTVQQYSVSHSQAQQRQQHLQSIQGALGGAAPVKLEPHMINDRIGLHQQLQSLPNRGPVKLEQKQNLVRTGMGPVTLEELHSDQALQEQQEQQDFLKWSRKSSQAAPAQLDPFQRRIFQQRQRQQLLKALPKQGSHLQQNLPMRSITKPFYEPGMCAQRLTQYMFQQQHRPNDNNIEFWIKFVAEFFAPNARKRWCFSLYENSGRAYGAYSQDVWNCKMCTCKPGRGFETTVEALPRLFKMKYDSGTLEELLYVDMPCEYQDASGHIILNYAKAVHESVFEHLRIVRDGQLRLVFSPDLRICSWEFCARDHEELLPRRLLTPQVSDLGAAAQKYQASARNAFSDTSVQDLKMSCNMFDESARRLEKALELPLVTKLGYMKSYARCLQISDGVNIMKDLIDYCQETGKGPMESYANFALHGLRDSAQKPKEKQQIMGQNMNDDQLANAMPSSVSNDILSINSHGMMPTCTSAATIHRFLDQHSKNSPHENQLNNPNSPCTGTPVQIPSTGSSTVPPAQGNPSSPLSSPLPSSSNNPFQTSRIVLTSLAPTNHISAVNSPAEIQLQRSSQLNEGDPIKSQHSVEQIIQEMVSSSQYGDVGSSGRVGSVGNKMKINQLTQISKNFLSHWNSVMGNGR